MSGRKNENTSETFGKFTGSAASSAGRNADGPKNITPDMWAPISGGKSPQSGTAPKKKTAPKQPSSAGKSRKKTSSQSAETKKAEPPISEGRRKEEKPSKSVQKKKTKNRTPKGRPVSELAAHADKQLEKARNQREYKNRTKANDDSERQLHGGIAPGEVSKKRAENKKKKRGLRSIAIILLFTSFVAIFFGVYIYAKGTPITAIVVEGDSIYSDKQIAEASGIELGSNMFVVKEKTVNGLICAELPYIHSVSVRWKLPDSIVITVTPTTDRFLIVNGQKYICVDAYDRVVSHEVKKLAEGLYRIKGFEKQKCEIGSDYVPSENNAIKYETVKKIVEQAEKYDLMKKGVINIADVRNVRFYCNGVMIYMGSCYDIERQISDAYNVLNTQFAEGETGYINVKTKVPAFQKGNIKAD